MISNLMLDHIAINVDSIEDSVSWYRDVTGATVDYADDTWAMLDVEGSKIALTVTSQHPPHIAFRVSTLEELGSEYREHRDGSCYVYKVDPSGNTIELIYWRSNGTEDAQEG